MVQALSVQVPAAQAMPLIVAAQAVASAAVNAANDHRRRRNGRISRRLIFSRRSTKLVGVRAFNRIDPFRTSSRASVLPSLVDSPRGEFCPASDPMSLTALETLNREFLEIRCRILDLAAMLDRLERTDDNVADDPRLKRVHEALDVLKKVREERAEQVQLTFSRPYDESWQQVLKVKPR